MTRQTLRVWVHRYNEEGAPGSRIVRDRGADRRVHGQHHRHLSPAEKSPKWRAIGLVAAFAMILLPKSRLALVALVVVPFATWGLSRLLTPWVLMLGAFLSTLDGLVATMVLLVVEDAVETFRSARADSTRVRLARIHRFGAAGHAIGCRRRMQIPKLMGDATDSVLVREAEQVVMRSLPVCEFD